MSTKHILLWLEAPLQSWGADSKFGRRYTLDFPTKSGVTGILLCALGATGEQRELLAELAPLGFTVVSFVPEKRTVHEPLLRDFHMVGSGYVDSDPWANLHIPKTSEGKKAVGGGTKMTYRYYLQDARFGVAFEVPAVRADEFENALQNPMFDIYLGRKSCVPTDFIFRGVFKDKESAIEVLSSIAKEKSLVEVFQVLDGEHSGESFTLNDVPVQFGTIKKYRDRRVSVVYG
jgi:CRISPR system Cascade subunit CasD